MLSLRHVLINRGGDGYRENDDETNAAEIFDVRDDGPVREYLHVSACVAATRKCNTNRVNIIARFAKGEAWRLGRDGAVQFH